MKNKSSGILLIVMGWVLAAWLLPGTLYTQADQEHREHDKIVEEVSVTWWQVPVFAVDKDGNPVTNLEAGDLEIRLNDGIIPTFDLDKRSYSVTTRKSETVQTPSAKQTPLTRPKAVFLVFDQALSGVISTRRAKNLAQKIVLDAAVDTRFYVLTIDAFAGLVYVGEGTGDNKDNLTRLIKDKIVEKQNTRVIDHTGFAVMMNGKQGGKYVDEEEQVFIEAGSKWFKRKSMGLFYAFKTLSFFLNSIEDNKFLYYFSEGMSNSILTANRSLAGDRGMYNEYFRRIARNLNRSGAVIFIINTMGVDQYTSAFTTMAISGGDVIDSSSQFSGEDSLHLLTRESGGTYIEGVDQQIMEKLEKMHAAYYEISFPDPPQIKGMSRDIEIKSKRAGVIIHSLRYLEKPKAYSRMKAVEKDMLVLNLVTQPQNAFIKSQFTAYNAQVDKTEKDKKQIAYSVTLPPSQISKEMDLFKVWLSTDNQATTRVEKIEKETLKAAKNPLHITFDLAGVASQQEKRKKDKDEKDAIPREIKAYFVLVNGAMEPARIYVHGLELYDEDPELVQLLKKELGHAPKGGKTISDLEMKNILQGAADYCERLKQSAFHFYCREKILETSIPLSEAERVEADISEGDMRRRGMSALREIREKAYTRVKGYLFGYRLIKQSDQIKEERDFISSRDEIPVNRDQVIKTTAFFSEKSIFAPITLLDRTRQDKYNFQFIRYAKHNDRQAAVLRAEPKDLVETASIFGDIWIDLEDFSVMKIEADPRSIKSYNLLENFARKLRTRLALSLEIQFDLVHEGIRFPTQVNMLEKYKGGRIIADFQGSKGWERTRVQFSYSDYQFFSVETDVKIQ